MLLFFKDEISLALSIEDYVPVLLFAAGLYYVAKMVAESNKSAGNLAFIGGVLVTLGGLFKASWKLIQALGGNDIVFLNNSLFTLMSAGFICLAWAFWKRKSEEQSFGKISLIPFALIAIIWSISGYFGFFTDSRVWFFILLGATTLANLALLFQLIFTSFKQKLWLSVALFFINLICIFVLARSSDQTVTLQWVKQLINTCSQIAFLTASYFLFVAIQKRNSQ